MQTGLCRFCGECFFRARSGSNFRFFEKISEQGAAAATCNFFREELEGREAAAARAPPAAGEKQKHELDRLQKQKQKHERRRFLFTGGATVTNFSGGKQRPDWEGTAAIQLIRGFPTSVARGGRSSRRGGARTGSGRTEVARRRRARGGKRRSWWEEMASIPLIHGRRQRRSFRRFLAGDKDRDQAGGRSSTGL